MCREAEEGSEGRGGSSDGGGWAGQVPKGEGGVPGRDGKALAWGLPSAASHCTTLSFGVWMLHCRLHLS